MEFSLALFWRTGERKYIDEIEKTLYNHLLGALEEDGSDFAYYQPNFGRRITRTAESMYKCCRYRGFTAVSHLPDMLFGADENTVTPILYANARYEDERWLILEETEWPYRGNVSFKLSVREAGVRTLRLHIPAKTENPALFVDGEELSAETPDGWIDITRDWSEGNHEILLEFQPEFVVYAAEIDGVKRIAAAFGCVLLAAETPDAAPEGAWEQLAVTGGCNFTRMEEELLAFDADGTRICDYASAGRNGREFVVWMKIR